MRSLKWLLLALTVIQTFVFCDPHPIDLDNITTPPLSQTSANYKKMLTEASLMVFALLGFVLLAIFILKRISSQRTFQMNREKYIKIIERRPLSPKTSIYLIQVGDQKIVLTESQVEVRSHLQLNPEKKNPTGFLDEEKS